MKTFVHYLPLVTTVIAVSFAVVLFRRWSRNKSALHLAWWTLGVLTYGIGTLIESLTTLLGWHESLFRAWYISGALLGGAPLAQGTVYLLLPDKTAHKLAGALLTVVCVASIFILMSPINLDLVEYHRLSGRVFEWQWVRAFSPFINTYAFIFLVGGACWSAWQYWKHDRALRNRFWGNFFIAVGAVLPGIGGSSARAGYVEVLYVTELIGLCLIWLGYRIISRDAGPSIHAKQSRNAAGASATPTLRTGA